MDLLITPMKDEERERIEVTKKELDEERKKFTEAAVRLGREREKLEVRLYFHFPYLGKVLIKLGVGRTRQIPRRETILAGSAHAGRPPTDTCARTCALYISSTR